MFTSRRDFSFCGCFYGNGITSAAQWLKKLEIELAPHGTVSPNNYVDILLMGDASDWADKNYNATRLLAEEKPTVQSVNFFTNLLQQWFPSDPEALPVVVDIVSLLSPLSIPSAPPVISAPLVAPLSTASILPIIQSTSSSNQLVLSSEIVEPVPIILLDPPSPSQVIQYTSSSVQIFPSSVLPASLARSHLI